MLQVALDECGIILVMVIRDLYLWIWATFTPQCRWIPTVAVAVQLIFWTITILSRIDTFISNPFVSIICMFQMSKIYDSVITFLQFHSVWKIIKIVSFEFSRQNCLLQLSSYAEEWAQKLAREDTFEHRTNQELGENLYCSWSSNPKAKCPGDKPVDSWYSEIKKYSFGAEPTNLSSGKIRNQCFVII